MRRSSVGAALVVLVLFIVPSAFADPIAQWTGVWMVTLGDKIRTDVGDVELARAFGDDGDVDEQILNVGSSNEALPGTKARAKVFGQVSGACLINCFVIIGRTSIEFERTFKLEGSPSGEWEVALIGHLVGGLRIITLGQGVDLNPRGTVSATGWISAASDPGTRLLAFGSDHQVDRSFEPLSVDDSLANTGFLGNGVYVVHGTLEILMTINEARTESGTTEADFFTGEGAGLRVDVAATPRVTQQSLIITSAYQTILHRSPTNEEIDRALAYLQAGGTQAGLRGHLLARFVAVY